MFVGHPKPHRAGGIGDQGGQPLGGLPPKGFTLGRVLLRVSLARHFQDSADFSQPVIDRGQGQFLPGLLAHPPLDILGPAELSQAQFFHQLLLQALVQRGFLAPAILALQQCFDASM